MVQVRTDGHTLTTYIVTQFIQAALFTNLVIYMRTDSFTAMYIAVLLVYRDRL